MENKIVESVGRGTVCAGSLRELAPRPDIQKVRVIKRDAAGNVTADITMEARSGDHGQR